MALKSKKKQEEKEVLPNEVTQEMMTQNEKEAIQKAEEIQMKEGANTKRLQLATQVVSSHFDLNPTYSVNKFDDKGKVVSLTLENRDFIISVTIKDSDKYGMNVETQQEV